VPDLDNGNFNFPRTMTNTPIPGSVYGSGGTMTSGIAENSSVGYGNYNGGFISFGTRGWHGLTMQQLHLQQGSGHRRGRAGHQ
jgi:hypothetical protein